MVLASAVAQVMGSARGDLNQRRTPSSIGGSYGYASTAIDGRYVKPLAVVDPRA